MAPKTKEVNKFFDRHPDTLTNEEKVRIEIVKFCGRYLDSNEIEEEHSYPDGTRADILIPKARVVIETKSPRVDCGPDVVGDNKTQFEQLSDYIDLSIERESDDLFAEQQGNTLDRDWIGVLTNGKVWWAWRWDENTGEVTQIENLYGVPYEPLTADELRKVITREAGKSWIPENPHEVFKPFRQELTEIAGNSERIKSLATQKTIWEDLIRGSGIPIAEDRKDKIYLDHILLLAVSRLVVAASTQHGHDHPESAVKDSFGGWLCESQNGEKWLGRLNQTIGSYNWKARRKDVLRNLYENMIEKTDRKLFGEYYTPDWLAGLVVEQILDEKWLKESINAVYNASEPVKGVGVLDPTCGSGSFLYAAALRIWDYIPNVIQGIDNSEKSNIVLRLVNGIDIHPLAVEMAQATLFRAIQGQPTAEPQVFQGDSLLIDREWGEGNLIAQGDDATFEFPRGSDNLFSVPYDLANRDDMAKRLRLLVDSARNNRVMPKGVVAGLNKAAAKSLRHTHNVLTDIIEKYGNGIWIWYISNGIAPHALHRRKINRIVANPPWLTYNEIQVDERKHEVREKAEELDLWVGGKSASSFDIASLFVAETRKLYLADKKKNRAAFVLNHAATRTKTWGKFRAKGYTKGVLSLLEKHPDGVILRQSPFHGAEACVVGLPLHQEERVILRGEDRISRDLAWSEVAPRIKRIPNMPSPKIKRSFYEKAPKEGSSIRPAVLLRIDPTDQRKTLQPTRAKNPWSELDPFELDDIPDHWRTEYINAESLLVFGIKKSLPRAVIPSNETGDLISDDDARRTSNSYRKLANHYDQRRGIGSNTPKTLIARINYNNTWSSQFPLRTSVFYNTSGQILRSAVGKHPVEDRLCRLELNTANECHYVCAMLNAKCLSLLFMQSRESDRDFHLNPLRKVPVPQYDKSNKDHAKLVSLSKRLHKQEVNDPDLLNQVSEIAGRVFLKANPEYKDFVDP